MANKIIVTGGAGFIGSHASKKLLERGDYVIIVDNFNDYYDPSIKRARVQEILKKYNNVEIAEADIADYSKMEEIFKRHKIDKVCHLAAQAGVRYSLINPFAYERSNVLGTLNILELCRHYSVNHLIYASSSSVYGANKKMPFSEEDRVDSPISLYSATKKSNEEMVFTYNHLYKLNCTGLRFFTVYGPWGRPDMALFKFTKNIIEDKPIDVYNNGEMARDFTFISDIVDGIIVAIDKCHGCEIFNLARGESVGLMEYIKEIEENLKRKAIKNMMPMQSGDVPATSADISKAKEKLGYNPKVSIKEGVKKFVDWYKEYYLQ